MNSDPLTVGFSRLLAIRGMLTMLLFRNLCGCTYLSLFLHGWGAICGIRDLFVQVLRRFGVHLRYGFAQCFYRIVKIELSCLLPFLHGCHIHTLLLCPRLVNLSQLGIDIEALPLLVSDIICMLCS